MSKFVLFALFVLCVVSINAHPTNDDLSNRKDEKSHDANMNKTKTEKSAAEASMKPYYRPWGGPYPYGPPSSPFQSAQPGFIPTMYQSTGPTNTYQPSGPVTHLYPVPQITHLSAVPNPNAFQAGVPVTHLQPSLPTYPPDTSMNLMNYLSNSFDLNPNSGSTGPTARNQLSNDMHPLPKNYYGGGLRGGLRGYGSQLLGGYNQYNFPPLYGQPTPAPAPFYSHRQPMLASQMYPSAYSYNQFGYDSYPPIMYRRDAEEGKLHAVSMEQPMQPSVQYQTKYYLKPQELADQPQFSNEYTSSVEYMPALGARESASDVLAVNVLPGPYSSIRKNDVMIDDKLNLNLGPTYFSNRILSSPEWMNSIQNIRAVDESELSNLPAGSLASEDQVFLELTPITTTTQEQHVSQPSYKSADITGMPYYPMPYSNMITTWITPKGDTNAPFSQDQIKTNMMQYYGSMYGQNLNDIQQMQQRQKDNPQELQKVANKVLEIIELKSRSNNSKDSKDEKKADQEKDDKMKTE